jgi:hypothetical protein
MLGTAILVLFVCTYSLAGCIPDLLADKELAQVAATRPALLP